MSESVILLHGLWLRAFTLGRLAHALRDAGYAVQGFNYRSLLDDPDRAVASLASRMETVDTPVHLVGHSMGGLVALIAVREHDLPVRRVVCMGSPLNGSRVAQRLGGLRGVRGVLGRSSGLLSDGLCSWEGSTEVGVIAGSRSVGLGFLAGGLEKPHDGTVTVAETRLAGIADHCVVRTTHSGLLFSNTAIAQTLAFLQSGAFRRA